MAPNNRARVALRVGKSVQVWKFQYPIEKLKPIEKIQHPKQKKKEFSEVKNPVSVKKEEKLSPVSVIEGEKRGAVSSCSYRSSSR